MPGTPRGGDNGLRWEFEAELLSIEGSARAAGCYLYDSWKRPVRHNLKIERLALWNTVLLEGTCRNVVESEPSATALTELGRVVDPLIAFEIEATIRTIPHLSPFDEPALHRLQSPTGKTFDYWGVDMAEREPELVGAWHDWLWSTDEPETHGRAGMLAMATMRLSDNLRTVFGWSKSEGAGDLT